MVKGTLDDILEHIFNTHSQNNSAWPVYKSRFKAETLSENRKKKIAMKYGYRLTQEAIYSKR